MCRSTPTRCRVGSNVAAEVPIVGDPKLVLRQMIELVRGAGRRGPQQLPDGWAKWRRPAPAFDEMVADRQQQHHADDPGPSRPSDGRPGVRCSTRRR